MKIGIIGAGNIGSTLARRLAALPKDLFAGADGVVIVDTGNLDESWRQQPGTVNTQSCSSGWRRNSARTRRRPPPTTHHPGLGCLARR